MEAGSGTIALAERPRDDGLRFSRFMYLPRVFGLALADQALYRAKAGGRNRAVLSNSGTEP